ncbi:WxL domain-containing protein [Candidatus Enterococcus clewellii]|uniref:WxL domain-containing protein n=1 Tax=Candidatus Enterococcus clewellii TaxID=1834193 RepID=A0A242K004_9ENTE|nr:WxL domain-containing protein [Enterococcus sp. 9E7_DIV0242]OTP10513.1 hypothetical protein A5888_003811 [Enterococcus sp. 9E7_DIV0242]
MKLSIFSVSLLALLSFGVIHSGTTAYADPNVTNNGVVEFEGGYGKDVQDPEKPGNVVDPGPSPSTDGPLRIEFVPQLGFGQNKITKGDRLYEANAQLFFGDTGPRGNFIQVSDYRGTRGGWTLQVRQTAQFENPNTLNNQLKGAVISFDKSWVNSTWDLSKAPSVSKDIIQLDNIGDTYTLAEAAQGKGEGTWLIEFGASEENTNGQANTLSPSLTPSGEQIVDPAFENKPVYKNSAVTLSIPEATKIDPVPYTTVLTWILSELP